MNLEKQNKSDDDIKKNKFTANNRYFTICIYTMFVIFFGAIIINLITSWNTTLKNIEKGLAVLMPFIIGALIAYILNPAVARFYKLFRDKCKIKSDALCKILAIITAYVLVIGIIVIVLFGVIPQIITSLTDLVNFIPTAAQQLYRLFDTLEERFPSLDTEVLRNTINNAIPNFINYAKDFAANMIPALYSISMSILKWVLNLFIAIMDGNKWRLFCLDFSFIGWELLCSVPLYAEGFLVLKYFTGSEALAISLVLLLTIPLSIGFFFVRPYEEAAWATFYRDITAAPTEPDEAY